MEDVRRYREDRVLQTGQCILRKFYNSIQGSSTVQTLYKMNKYLKVAMHNNDLAGFDADWDAPVEILLNTELKGMVENEEMLKIRYYDQIKNQLFSIEICRPQ